MTVTAPRPFVEDTHTVSVIAYFYCCTKRDNYMQKRGR
jgi:CRISPR/Cas system-associated exonuclease Cas4 (RecB family)